MFNICYWIFNYIHTNLDINYKKENINYKKENIKMSKIIKIMTLFIKFKIFIYFLPILFIFTLINFIFKLEIYKINFDMIYGVSAHEARELIQDSHHRFTRFFTLYIDFPIISDPSHF